MKIIYFTKYSRQGASSRLRSFQYIPFLKEKGYEFDVSPLFDDRYLQRLYSGESVKWSALCAYLKRFFCIFSLFRYDQIVIEKELFPYMPAWAERMITWMGKKYVVDYDDAIFHNYDLHPNGFVRRLLKKKIDYVMRYSSTVIAGNVYLADRAQKAGAKDIQIIPTVVDITRYRKKEKRNSEPVVVGWMGTQSTFKYVKEIKAILNRLMEEYNIVLHIVGAKEDLGLGESERHIVWTEDTEVESILNFDIGVMPLLDTPWEQGKCGYKLIQYMACGIPVVASAVGANNGIVSNGENGYLVKDDSGWYEALKRYVIDEDLREVHGTKGSQLVEEKYSLQSQLVRYVECISKA